MSRTAIVLPLLFLIVQVTIAQDRPPIGIIDFYGLRTVPQARVREMLALKEGDAVPANQSELEQKLAAIPDIVEAHLAPVCCDSGKAILYVGIQEKGAKQIRFNPVPTGNALLPADILKACEALDDALMKAVQKGDAGEDDSLGHSLAHDPTSRAIQERFVQFASRDHLLLAKVLSTASNATHRAHAAEVLAYSINKQSVVDPLVSAAADPSSAVRNNAVRALGIIAGFAQNHPEINVPSAPFIDLLTSPIWTDRNKASFVLMQLTERRDPDLLKQLKTRALPELIEMAHWKSRSHSFPFLIILGRIAGIPDAELFKALEDHNEELIFKALNACKGLDGL